jgi:hypothetical protein
MFEANSVLTYQNDADPDPTFQNNVYPDPLMTLMNKQTISTVHQPNFPNYVCKISTVSDANNHLTACQY